MITTDSFACPCCGENKIDPKLVERLAEAEKSSPTPFRITSGYRCEAHNKDKEVGGSPTSSHLKGLAADIAVPSSWHRYHILWALLRAGFARIEIGSNYIHVDIDPDKPSPLVSLSKK